MKTVEKRAMVKTSRRSLCQAGCGLLLALGLASAAWALPGDPGRLLTYGSSARDVSMGGAVAAVPQGASSVYWNPALLSEVSRKDVSFLQAQLFGQTSMNWMGYAHPFKERAGTFAMQVVQLKTQSGDLR